MNIEFPDLDSCKKLKKIKSLMLSQNFWANCLGEYKIISQKDINDFEEIYPAPTIQELRELLPTTINFMGYSWKLHFNGNNICYESFISGKWRSLYKISKESLIQSYIEMILALFDGGFIL